MRLVKRVKRYFYVRCREYEMKHASKYRLKNAIVFESIPDFSDNTKAVFDEFVRQGINKHYKLIWFIYSAPHQTYPQIKNVQYVQPWSLEGQYYGKLAKVKVCCNHFLKKETDGQICVYLSHGTAIKDVSGLYTAPKEIDYFLTASENVIDLQSKVFCFPHEKMIALGFPRNDALGIQKRDIAPMLNSYDAKVIVWYPTYRQHKNGQATGASNALPIIFNAENAVLLNECARQKNTIIVIKPHFAQDVRYVQNMKLSNICFISDDFFGDNNITSYEFVASCDALITDYSSIYFDYTLCNKPIAAVWEDIEEYKKNPGLVKDYEYLMKGAEKVYTLNDLCDFIERVADGVDLLKAEREEIRDYANISTDACNASRVVQFILEKAGDIC